MKIKVSCVLSSVFVSLSALALPTTTKVDITSLSNADSRTMEACGTAVNSAGLKPILITVKHGNASYSTLSSDDGNWCVIIKRHTYNGASDAQGVPLKELLGN